MSRVANGCFPASGSPKQKETSSLTSGNPPECVSASLRLRSGLPLVRFDSLSLFLRNAGYGKHPFAIELTDYQDSLLFFVFSDDVGCDDDDDERNEGSVDKFCGDGV